MWEEHLAEYVLKIRNTDCSIQTQKSWWVALLKVKFIGFKLLFCLVQTWEQNLDLLHPSECFHCWVNVRACSSLLPHHKKKNSFWMSPVSPVFQSKKCSTEESLTISWWDEGSGYINGWCCEFLAWPHAGHIITSPRHSSIKLKELVVE